MSAKNVQASAKSGYDCFYINRNVSNEDNIKYWAADEAEKVVYILSRVVLITGQEKYETFKMCALT